DAPAVNDFLASILQGMLARLTTRWLGDSDGNVLNNLLRAEPGLLTVELMRHVRHLAELAMRHPEFVQSLCDASVAAIEQQMPSDFREGYRDYLERFGNRCLEELKLESPTLREDPLPLLRTIGRLTHHLMTETTAKPAQDHQTQLRRSAEEHASHAVQVHSMRRLVFWWVLHNTRQRLRDRENLRFHRARLIGQIRRIFLEIGKRLYASDLLHDPRDIFYLEIQEILGFIEGTATCTDLGDLVAVRKAEFDKYRKTAPEARFETVGDVYQSNASRAGSVSNSNGVAERRGIPCSPGVVKGRVRIVTDPQATLIKPGEILVAPRTDATWTALFPLAAGVIVEHGSLASHAAIVSCEMGIPSIVNVANITRWLKDGDTVELDATAGVIRHLSHSSPVVSVP
ncbi:MAG TPA: PEP-utilizing enzyme, partial [Tepidisphaeraceae bacterium]|nr:PEP-utilizing enzyme [Tepidisphaeraceae bacterium]